MSDALFRLGVVFAFVAAAAVVVRVSFFRAVDLPELPPRPPPAHGDVQGVARASAAVDLDPQAYAERLVGDSRALRIEPVATPDQLSAVFAHQVDTARRTLEPGRKRSTAEVLGLGLSLSVEDIEGSPRRQLVLAIANRTDGYLAYRVMTQSSRGLQPCHAKSDIAHDALALAPGETARRSECLYRSGMRLLVDRVETIALPPLSYHYVSEVPAQTISVDPRDRLAARGHRPPGRRPLCRVFHSAELDAALAKGSATWRDLVDFYARHPCEIFSFPIDYKAFEKPGERRLPAVRAAF